MKIYVVFIYIWKWILFVFGLWIGFVVLVKWNGNLFVYFMVFMVIMWGDGCVNFFDFFFLFCNYFVVVYIYNVLCSIL